MYDLILVNALAVADARDNNQGFTRVHAINDSIGPDTDCVIPCIFTFKFFRASGILRDYGNHDCDSDIISWREPVEDFFCVWF